jgi:hypothetical protein
MIKRAKGTLEALRDLPAQVKREPEEEYTPSRSAKRGASDGGSNEFKKSRRKATERPTVSRERWAGGDGTFDRGWQRRGRPPERPPGPSRAAEGLICT